jgi:hypothetical protein
MHFRRTRIRDHRSGAGTGLGGLALESITGNVQRLKERDSTFTRIQAISRAHMISDQSWAVIPIARGTFNVTIRGDQAAVDRTPAGPPRVNEYLFVH